MPLIEHTLEGVINKVDVAIKRIQSFEPISNGLFDTPYYVAYSGGKDSDAIRILCELAGVKHDLVHNHTTVDAPETVRYIRSIPNIQISYPEMSMWKLIEQAGTPPLRMSRYCCSTQKERGGVGRFVMTGVRWAESTRRKSKRGGVEIQPSDIRKTLVLNADNDKSRMMFETCQMKGKRVLNPIIDWSANDVWELLEYYGCPSNPLYKCGFTRIGCIGCPMARAKGMERQFARYPKYKLNYIKAFERMVKARIERNMPTTWQTGQDVFNWWMQDKNLDRQIEGQMEFEL